MRKVTMNIAFFEDYPMRIICKLVMDGFLQNYVGHGIGRDGYRR